MTGLLPLVLCLVLAVRFFPAFVSFLGSVPHLGCGLFNNFSAFYRDPVRSFAHFPFGGIFLLASAGARPQRVNCEERKNQNSHDTFSITTTFAAGPIADDPVRALAGELQVPSYAMDAWRL